MRLAAQPAIRIGRFDLDGRRRRTFALVAAPFGLLAIGLGVVMYIPILDGPMGAGAIPSLVVGVGVGLLLAGVYAGWLTLSRPNQFFVLHERGLVHRYAEHSRAIAWSEVAKVRNQGKDSALARMLGGDVSCRLSLRGGGTVTITGLTQNARHLADTVQRAVEEGVAPPGKP